jgi:hypothetical protein
MLAKLFLVFLFRIYAISGNTFATGTKYGRSYDDKNWNTIG